MSLIEILVAGIVFLVIFMGLATSLQSVVMVNHLATGINDCLDRSRLGLRLLKYGDATVPALAEAASARLDPATGRLRFASTPTSGEDREVYLEQGRLLMRALPVGTPLVLMGDEPAARSGVRVVPPPNGGWAAVATSTNGACLVRLTLRVFYDANHAPDLATHVCDADEPEMTLTSSIFLRNSDR
ncbi:MAG: hypothetical protein OZSIB_3574 [Candidatus Ozemobacter sibiricus]|jgi:hypothetical protein|uniref:Uncharacterized protein n=1 Tax=Candidatus Ozemobacter sibiricus TaxID=2268124 RepID=A0A367ZPV8_9BACT|nr:MAG: hypothetical protein OZSIB_3574 [Candidatus Ozemobacter sibiricus]